MTAASTSPAVAGYCAKGWERVRDAFEENFAARAELGASVCVVHRGETVVDLAGGWFDQTRTRVFGADDLVVFFSATKGMVAAAAHWLIDRGLLDLDAPVSRYWPEYAQNGKEATTVAMMLNHSAGVPGFHEPLKQDAHLDWDYMVGRIAAERPFWQPGLRNGYHALNFGWTVGELVRRVSGRGLGDVFRETIAEPAGADIWIGLPESEEGRVSKVIPTFPAPGEPVIEVYTNVQENPQSDSALVFTNSGGWSLAAIDAASGDCIVNTRAHHAAVFGGAGGIGNARGLARVYAALDAGTLISRDHVARMSQTSMVSTRDPILLVPTRFALGFMKSMDNRALPLGTIKSFIVGEKAFGHVGAGGSFGMLDREEGLAAGYTMNRLGVGVWLDERGQSLVDAMYRTLGYRTNAPGVWVK
ncbi:MAG: serine hydrolase domain-containing protein [Rhizomicrobium sp.]